MNTYNEPSLGTIARSFGGVVMDESLTERLGLVVIDGRKVADDDAIDFVETVAATFGDDVAEWLTGTMGSCWYSDVIYVGADVAGDVKDFVVYHEFKHYLDYVGRGVVPSDEHSTVRSSRIEKECDLYALRRVVQEMGTKAVEAAIEWMVNYHFQWNVEHPDDPSDLLYRAILLYRFCQQNGIKVDPVVNMRKLQKSERWWR